MASDSYSGAPRRILCVHQGGELYGSDRSFLQAVAALRRQYPGAYIAVLLAADGPLEALLREVSDEVRVRDLLVLRLANMLVTLFKCTIGLPFYVARAWWTGRDADLVYVNTSVIADYMIAARLSPRRFILHVREIPKAKVMPVIRGFCRFSGAMILFNSRATADAFALPATQRQAVIHNGSDPVPLSPRSEVPQHFSAERPLRLSLLGRINNWKGQDLLVEALALLDAAERAKLNVRIVGGIYGNSTEPRDALLRQIAAAQLEPVVSVEDFKDDPAEVYAWSDANVVPSRLPEPFGRVAIEAMAIGRPVIAAGHGGLLEIVEDRQSGWLFPPNDAAALANIIRSIQADPPAVTTRGAAALERFSRDFSTDAMSGKLRSTISQWMGWER